jgi:SAM-dependent methyltransferase
MASTAHDPETDEIKAAYDAVEYAYSAYVQTHPDRLATVAALHGVEAAPFGTASILEIGCGDGSNLIPIAERWPGARLVGCDLADRPVARGQALIRDLGLRNLELFAQDLRDLPADLGTFDYIIAHGFYSWVPESVREAMMALIGTRLTPNGVAFVSFNALPGTYIRRIAWDAMHFHTRAIPGTRDKIAAAREIAQLMAEPGLAQDPRDGRLRAELGEVAASSESTLSHDDLAIPNDPCYFQVFMQRATKYGLSYLGDAEVMMMTTAGLSAKVRAFVSGLDRLEAEQYLDFIRFRRFRQALLTKAPSTSNFAMIPGRLRTMHASVSSLLLQSMDQAEREGRPRESALSALDAPIAALVQWLISKAPATVTAEEIIAWRARNTPGDRRTFEAVMAGLYVTGRVSMHIDPAPLAVVVSSRPMADRVARRMAVDHPTVVNRRHESVKLADPYARRLLLLLDGTQDRAMLRKGLGSHDRGADTLEATLQFFARVSLLVS